MTFVRPILVVAGIGNGSGTGGATARLFAKNGYRVALVARNVEYLNTVAGGINKDGGEAAAFPVNAYTYTDIANLFKAIRQHQWPSPEKGEIRVALWNAGHGVWKNFLDIAEDDIKSSVEGNIVAPFAFSREVITAFKENTIDERGRRGTLLFTGSTASLRGTVITSAFSAGKHGLRALSQSLAKEFGKDNIHVTHTIIDGSILTDRSVILHPNAEAFENFKKNRDIRVSPESIAESYLYLTNQDRSAWTWELDLRPAHGQW